jgi:hypothetical protein
LPATSPAFWVDFYRIVNHFQGTGIAIPIAGSEEEKVLI